MGCFIMKFEIKTIGRMVCCIIIFCLCITFAPDGMNSISNERSEGVLPDFLSSTLAQEVNSGSTAGTSSEEMSETKSFSESDPGGEKNYGENNENNKEEFCKEYANNAASSINNSNNSTNRTNNTGNSTNNAGNSINNTNNTNYPNNRTDVEIINGNGEDIEVIGKGFYTHNLFFTEDAQRYVIVYPDDTYVSLTRNKESEHKSYDEICGFL